MTLQRGYNGWARKSRWSLGSVFWAWSAATHCVCWLQDTVPCLCAKFGEQRCMFNEISSWSSMNLKMVNHVSEKWLYIFKVIKQRLGCVNRTVNWDDSMILMRQSDTTIKFRACKTKGHIRAFQRYFHSWSQQGFRLLFITSIEADPWILSAAWLASMMHWRNIGDQANLLKLSRVWFLKIEIESLMQFRWCNTRTTHRAIMNDWIYQLDLPLHKEQT